MISSTNTTIQKIVKPFNLLPFGVGGSVRSEDGMDVEFGFNVVGSGERVGDVVVGGTVGDLDVGDAVVGVTVGGFDVGDAVVGVVVGNLDVGDADVGDGVDGLLVGASVGNIVVGLVEVECVGVLVGDAVG